jgi:putative redox protein
MARIAHTTAECIAGYSTTIAAGPHRVIADEPEAQGGGGTGPTPYQLLLASLAACSAITLRMYAQRKGWSLGAVRVDLELHKDDKQSTGRIVRTVSFGEVLSAEQESRLAEIVEKTPVTLTLKAGTPIATTFRK